MTTTAIIAFASVLSAFGGATAAVNIYQARAQRRKIVAQARSLEVEPEVLLSKAYSEFTDRVVRQLKDAEAKIERQETHIRALEDELRKHGIVPPPWPALRVVDDGTA